MISKPPPPLNFIRSFEAAARLMNFTAAANELGLSQAAVSNHVRSLEKYVGRALFHRLPQSLELTDDGRAFLPTLRDGLALIDGATEAISQSPQKTVVSISCPLSFASVCLPPLIIDFAKIHPNVCVNIYGNIWASPTDNIPDLKITMDREGTASSEKELLWHEDITLVGPPQFTQVSAENIQIKPEEIIVMLGRHEYWIMFAEVLSIDLPDLRTCHKVSTSLISLSLVERGLGWAVVPGWIADPYIKAGRVSNPFGLRLQTPWQYNVSTEGNRIERSTSLFKNFLIQWIRHRKA